jgi:hypothetical protein
MTTQRPSAGRLAPILAGLAALAGAVVLSAPPVQAQAPLPIDPMQGQYERDLRALQGQAATDPSGAAAGAAVLQRQLENESGGVRFSPDRARVDRDLQALRQAPTAAEPPTPLPPAPDTRLPSSYRLANPNALPSTQNEARLVGQLLDRAQGNIQDGDTVRAGSDLATAAATLDGLRGALPPAQLKALDGRLDILRRRLSGG